MIKLKEEYYQSSNILTEKELFNKLAELRRQGRKIGLCTGSFDLLHPGHITHLEAAKKVCDVLFVAIARDLDHAKTKKERGRPIFSHSLRAFMVSKLKPVDYVFLDNWIADINKVIRPDVYIKGKDYAGGKEDDQEKIVSSYGGKTYYTADEKLSTTDIINYIRNHVG